MADGIVMSVEGVVSRRAFRDPAKTRVLMEAAAASLGINTVDQTPEEWQQDLLDYMIEDAAKRGLERLERSDVDGYRAVKKEQLREEFEL